MLAVTSQMSVNTNKTLDSGFVTNLSLIRYSRTSPFFATAMRGPAGSGPVHTNHNKPES